MIKQRGKKDLLDGEIKLSSPLFNRGWESDEIPVRNIVYLNLREQKTQTARPLTQSCLFDCLLLPCFTRGVSSHCILPHHDLQRRNRKPVDFLQEFVFTDSNSRIVRLIRWICTGSDWLTLVPGIHFCSPFLVHRQTCPLSFSHDEDVIIIYSLSSFSYSRIVFRQHV